ncbi:MAG TPA: hypothetical protein VGN72_20590 [Tepidisphaeraceae bacterium]|jgi:hypothetical protein|nr:hypothetical protein [Tepidisphaeraceae bacterium]
MVAIKTKFNGESIEVPAELRGAKPTEVVVVFEEPATVQGKGGHSIWDVVARSTGTRTAEDIDAQVRAERAEWGDR